MFHTSCWPQIVEDQSNTYTIIEEPTQAGVFFVEIRLGIDFKCHRLCGPSSDAFLRPAMPWPQTPVAYRAAASAAVMHPCTESTGNILKKNRSFSRDIICLLAIYNLIFLIDLQCYSSVQLTPSV